MLSNVKIGEEGARLRFYLNKVNNRGWGVLYLFVQWGCKRVRLSCGVKCKGDYWSNGNVSIPHHASRVERVLCGNVSKVIEGITEFVDVKYYDYLCGENIDIEKELKKYTSNLMGKKENVIRISDVWETIINSSRKTKAKTKEQYGKDLSVFKNYLREKKIGDDIENLTTSNIRGYREWLMNSDRETNTSDQYLKFVKRMSRKMKQLNENYTHSIDWDAIEPIIDGRTKKEKQDSKPALTMEEIARLEALELQGTKEIVRDIMLILIFAGIRYEDLGVFLKSENLKEVNGEKYIFITPEKTKEKSGETSVIPLERYYPQLLPLWEKYKDTKPMPYRTHYGHIKEIGELAKLDREIVVTSDKCNNKGKKTKEVKKVWELISSHKGRRSFITNAQREFDLEPSQIKEISGHRNESIITECYTSMTDEEILQQKVKRLSPNNAPTSTTKEVKQEEKPSKSNNYMIDGIEEAIRVLSYLGVELTSKDIEILNFDDLCRMIEMEHSTLMDNFGIDVMELKDLFNFHKPMVVRRALLVKMIEMMIR